MKSSTSFKSGKNHPNWKGGVSSNAGYRQQQTRVWKIVNKKHLLDKERERYQKNKEKIKTNNRKWYSENKSKVKEQQKEYKIKNREKVNFNKLIYKKRSRFAEGKHTLQEWSEVKKSSNYTCLNCGKSEPEIKLTRDHIIPLSKGGTNYIWNIQPLCRVCNSIKSSNIS